MHPPLLDVLDCLADHSAAPWVRKCYLAKLSDQYQLWYSYNDESLRERVEQILKLFPEGNEIRANLLKLRLLKAPVDSEKGQEEKAAPPIELKDDSKCKSTKAGQP